MLSSRPNEVIQCATFERRSWAAVATAELSAPSAALAQIDSVSVDEGRLGPEGASVVVTMTYQCQPGFAPISEGVTLAQSTGFKLARLGYLLQRLRGSV